MKINKEKATFSIMVGVFALLYAALIVIGLTGCAAPTEPGARERQPDAAFAPLWAQVEACSGKTRPMSEIHWFELPGALTFEHKGQEVLGYYREPDQIVMGEEAYYLDTPLRHEMLHAILGLDGHDLHPAEFFEQRCKGLV